jgi:hypothetical protein
MKLKEGQQGRCCLYTLARCHVTFEKTEKEKKKLKEI